MSKGGGKSAVKSLGTGSSGNVAIGGVVELPGGKFAVKLRVGGKEILIPAGGNVQGRVTAIRDRLLALGSRITGTVVPKKNSRAQVSLTGPKGSLSLTGDLA